MTVPYVKPYLSYAQQLELLRARNLVVDDESHALWHLQKLGYYRLSGYCYPYRALKNR